MSEDRYDPSAGLLGPKDKDEWVKWRRARDRAIANPPRNKAAQLLNQKKKEADEPHK